MTDVTPRFKTPKQNPRALDAARAGVLRRSRGWCEVRWDDECSTVAVAVHHVLRRSQGGAHDMTNLVATCTRCHERIHANPALARARGLLAGMKHSVTEASE